MAELSHTSASGEAQMVDITSKSPTNRCAVASSRLLMSAETLSLISEGGIPKGDVFAVARIAGIQAAKRTSELIPLCHPLSLTNISIEFSTVAEGIVDIEATVNVTGKTGAEMEALTAVSVAALTIYDMCKAVQKDLVISETKLEFKSGGKSGNWHRS